MHRNSPAMQFLSEVRLLLKAIKRHLTYCLHVYIITILFDKNLILNTILLVLNSKNYKCIAWSNKTNAVKQGIKVAKIFSYLFHNGILSAFKCFLLVFLCGLLIFYLKFLLTYYIPS